MIATAPLAGIKERLSTAPDAAAEQVAAFMRAAFHLPVRAVRFHQDSTSLNSVRGYVELDSDSKGAPSLFFKFHTEEKEDTVAEYYRAQLLAEAGFPVDVPVHVSHTPGAQMVLYKKRDWPRFFDQCRDAEQQGCPEHGIRPLIREQIALDTRLAQKIIADRHPAAPDAVAQEPIHQLFIWRLVEEGDITRPGGRWGRFYEHARFTFPGLDAPLSYAELARLRWRINGCEYPHTLHDIVSAARTRLTPAALAQQPAAISHGDAHNANLWRDETQPAGRQLLYYDPAFAGKNIPVLLGEIKPLFHNIFAHADWLYHPAEADAALRVGARRDGNLLDVTHNWRLTPLRAAFLHSKAENFYKPLLATLAADGTLPKDWEDMMRAALFCCPTLVMNLTPGAGNHTPQTGLLGLALAVMLGSRPGSGTDIAAQFFADIAPE